MLGSIKNWVRISLANLMLVSVIGALMRYKIVYSFPFVNQSFLLHAHSHFAFSGWVSQLLMALMVFHLYRFSMQDAIKKYRFYLWANLLVAYGMMISFSLQGYGTISIIFSTLSILVSYAFSLRFWKDSKKTKEAGISNHWLLAALLFNVLSSLGPFHLSYLMATDTLNENSYLKSIYFYLHFQYNGWFFFACIGLLFSWLRTRKIRLTYEKLIFRLFFFACFPAYLLSVLWLPVVQSFLAVVIAAVCMQLLGYLLLIRGFLKQKVFSLFKGKISLLLFKLAALAFTIKLLLQTGSVIPELSKLAFGFRPIVIGYLHLVLLGVITLFLFGYLFMENLIEYNRTAKKGLTIFIIGVILNEAFLMIQGVAAIKYIRIQYINELLFAVALLLFLGLLLLLISQRNLKRKKDLSNYSNNPSIGIFRK